MINKQFSELAMDDMNLSQLNEEELMETQGGFLLELGLLAVGFVIQVAYDMGKNDGAKNRDK